MGAFPLVAELKLLVRFRCSIAKMKCLYNNCQWKVFTRIISQSVDVGDFTVYIVDIQQCLTVKFLSDDSSMQLMFFPSNAAGQNGASCFMQIVSVISTYSYYTCSYI